MTDINTSSVDQETVRMNFYEMRGWWAVSFLLLAAIFGPPLGLFLFNLGLPIFTSDVGFPVFSQFSTVSDYARVLFLTSYSDGLYPALTAVLFLSVTLSKSTRLRLWWVPVTAYLSTCIWYFFQIVINNSVFMVGFAAALSAFVLWAVVKLAERIKAML